MDNSAVIAHFEEIGRTRALTDDESLALEKAVRAVGTGGIYRRWRLEDNRELLKAARERGGLKAYAMRSDRTYVACQQQLKKLKRQRRRRGIACVGRFFYDGEIES